ncbi:hypothetical protein AVEN_217805-1 [Araneus ventricosus]|uniref:Uncharacterized protein n=1 Tax=Araneus ventricosus TaxID=182803 RepID=A0A4Y2HFE6_ARAVE|nr:hypothetical protein AVEN_217805-1 [Araneus ventricosus]
MSFQTLVYTGHYLVSLFHGPSSQMQLKPTVCASNGRSVLLNGRAGHHLRMTHEVFLCYGTAMRRCAETFMAIERLSVEEWLWNALICRMVIGSYGIKQLSF